MQNATVGTAARAAFILSIFSKLLPPLCSPGTQVPPGPVPAHDAMARGCHGAGPAASLGLRRLLLMEVDVDFFWR